jgi:hypothetical protein
MPANNDSLKDCRIHVLQNRMIAMIAYFVAMTAINITVAIIDVMMMHVSLIVCALLGVLLFIHGNDKHACDNIKGE